MIQRTETGSRSSGFPCTTIVVVISIPPEEISCVDFVFDVVEDFVIAVCDDGIATVLEAVDIVDDKRTEKCKDV